jgi:4,5-dihydroxyphthalate decarboxylase
MARKAKKRAVPKKAAPRKKAAARKKTRAGLVGRPRAEKAAPLKLKFGCGTYDRLEALWTGAVKVKGVELAVTRLDFPRKLFDLVDQGKLDAGEYGMTGLVENAAIGDDRFVCIPVFPSKMFRHGYIYVNRRSGIREPKDLAGQRIGVPSMTQTAAIWQRGFLEHDYGADLSGVTWVVGQADRPGPLAPVPKLHVPTRIEPAPADKSLDDLLVAGDIVCMMGANRAPSLGKNPDIVRLFPDYAAEERAYYKRTGIHPIMHGVVIKRRLVERNPGLPAALYRACEQAKAQALAHLRPWGAQPLMLPWMEAELDEIDALFGGDPCAYGLAPNRKTIATLIDYMHEQGFIATKPRVDDMFVAVE